MDHRIPSRRRPTLVALLSATALLITSCGSSGGGAAPKAGASTTGTTPTTTSAPKALDPPADLEAQVQAVLDASMEPGAIDWTCCGADAPATGVSAAIRIPGHDDVIVASGKEVNGKAFDPMARFNTATLTISVVRTIAQQLIAEGKLDPEGTIETWAPNIESGADITVQMLLDGTNGIDYGEDIDTPNIVADFEKAWTLEQVVANLPGTQVTPPGTYGDDLAGTVILAHILQEETGQSLAQLTADRVTEPLSLDDTAISDGTDHPADFQHGVFSLEGKAYDTSMFPNTSYYTYLGASHSLDSTLPDLLDLSDAWNDGTLFEDGAKPTAASFPDGRKLQRDDGIAGLGIPIHGFCPCTPVGKGHEVASTGRRPGGLGTDLQVFRYADGVTVVVHFNSHEQTDPAVTRKVSEDLHDLVTG